MSAALHSTVSTSALIEAWNKKQQDKYLELQLINWMEYYIPACLMLVRPLRPEERVGISYQGDKQVVWYGAFEARTHQLQAVSDKRSALLRQLEKADCLVTLLQ